MLSSDIGLTQKASNKQYENLTNGVYYVSVLPKENLDQEYNLQFEYFYAHKLTTG